MRLSGDEEQKRYCDVCGCELDPEDYSINLCKICQGIVLK